MGKVLITSIIVIMLGHLSLGKLFDQHKGSIRSFDTAGDFMISASRNELLLWNGNHCLFKTSPHGDFVTTVSLSRNNKMFASSGSDKSIKIWRIGDKTPIQIIDKQKEVLNNLQFSANDQFLVAAEYNVSKGDQAEISIWDWKKGIPVKVLESNHTGFDINTNNTLAYVNRDSVLALFDLNSLTAMKDLGKYPAIPTFSRNGKIIVTNDFNRSKISFINIDSNKLINEITIDIEHTFNQISALTFSPDDALIMLSLWGGAIETWDIQQKKKIKTLEGGVMNSVDHLFFNSKNELISAGGDGIIKVWNWETGSIKSRIGGKLSN